MNAIPLNRPEPQPRPLRVQRGPIDPPCGTGTLACEPQRTVIRIGPASDRPVVVSVVFMAVLMALSAFAQVAPVRLSVPGHVLVSAGEVALGDIAMIETLDAPTREMLRDLDLGEAPRFGARRAISSHLIEGQIERAGFSTEDWEIDIPSSVVVEREAQTIADGTLEETLRSLLPDALPHEPQDLLIESVRVPREVTLPPGDIRWQVALTDQRRDVGTIGVELLALHGGSVVERIACTAQIDVRTAVVTAAGDIPRGTIIQPAMLRTAPTTLEQTRRGSLTDLGEAIGMAATRTIRAGDTLTERHVEAPRLVKRGEPVTVIYQSAGLHIQDTAVAMEDGAAGDVVAVQNTASQRSYRALVTDERTVRVVSARN